MLAKQGKETLEERQTAKKMFADLMEAKVRLLVREKRDADKLSGVAKDNLNHYFDCFAEHRGLNESVFDVVKFVGKHVAKKTAPKAYHFVSGAASALRKKRRAKSPTLKVPYIKKPSLKASASTEPVKIDRKEFAAKLRASGNRLNKTSLS